MFIISFALFTARREQKMSLKLNYFWILVENTSENLKRNTSASALIPM
jgi:hypothetical protein